MLAWAAAAVRHLDPGLDQAVADLTQVLRPHARSETVRAGLLLDPGRARDHAHVHILLSQLGHRDPEIDDLLRRSVADGASWRPERLPHRELEQHWLARLAPAGGDVRSDAGTLRRSSLGRPMDPLSATPLDAYAFTHAVLYASDFGARRFDLPRAPLDISADAEADPGREPRSRRPRPRRRAAVDLADAGLGLDPGCRVRLLGTAGQHRSRWRSARTRFRPGRLRLDGRRPGSRLSARHLLSLHVRVGLSVRGGAAGRMRARPLRRRARRQHGPGPELVALLEESAAGPAPRWQARWSELSAGQQDALTDFATAAVLARARNRGDLGLIRASLQIVSRYGSLAAPAPRQALALLQRAASYGRQPEPSLSVVSTRG